MDSEKAHDKETSDGAVYAANGHDEEVGIVNKADPLSRDLRGRHMQMIAIGMGYFSYNVSSMSDVLPLVFLSMSCTTNVEIILTMYYNRWCHWSRSFRRIR